MHAALGAEGYGVSCGRIERLMRRHGICALAGRRFPTMHDRQPTLSRGRPSAAFPPAWLAEAWAAPPNLLAQRFIAPAPGRVWLADITYIATGEGWLYLAAILGLATRKIVGGAAQASDASASLERRRRVDDARSHAHRVDADSADDGRPHPFGHRLSHPRAGRKASQPQCPRNRGKIRMLEIACRSSMPRVLVRDNIISAQLRLVRPEFAHAPTLPVRQRQYSPGETGSPLRVAGLGWPASLARQW